MTKASDFIADGHKVHFQWDRDKIEISHVECPHEGKTALCNKLRQGCVVNTFVGTYGSELNVGTVYINGPQEIAWLPIPGDSDLDRDFMQVWIVPIADTDYRAAIMLQSSEED